MRLRILDLRLIIQEALKRSDAESLVRALENAARNVNSRVSASVDASSGVFNVFVKLISGDVSIVESVIVEQAQKFGWTLLSMSDKHGVVWWFEPEADTKGPVSVSKLPSVMWHATKAENVSSIMEKGLMQNQRTDTGTTRRYLARIYLASEPGTAKFSVKGNVTLLKIDMSMLPKDMKFYVDQEFGYRKDGSPIAVYTTSQIPPEAIEVL